MFEVRSHADVCAEFQLVKLDKNLNPVDESGVSCNTVLNQGLDLIGYKDDWINAVIVGTGNSTPNVNQTGLDAPFMVSKNRISVGLTYEATPTPRYILTTVFRYNSGSFNNITLAEVAAGNSINTNIPDFVAFNRALLKDNEGSPTTITILSDESLEVRMKLYIYVETSDVMQTINIVDGSNTVKSAVNLTIRPCKLGDLGTAYALSAWKAVAAYGFGSLGYPAGYAGDIGTSSGIPEGSEFWSLMTSGVSFVSDAYVIGNYYNTGKIIVGLDAGNGSTKSLFIRGFVDHKQVGISPAISKNNTQVLTIPIKRSWGRYIP